ncbi:MAG: outer membrane beta-barrel family protein [Bacteroidaceae bacterium]|nr:outer membrane beta-barrel family protein [Bacteroidaceae bacterium]
MKKILLILILLSLVTINTSAQKNKLAKQTTIFIWGHVRDSFTKDGIKNVKIEIMNKDSVVLDSTFVFSNPQPSAGYDATYRTTVPAVPQLFIIKASHPDYEDCYVNFNMRRVARNDYFDAKWHYMKKREKKESTMDKELGEVVVKATKIRIAYRGDTIVYNADAFNVPEGSMLDGLLKQMDGVELSDDGVIKVNGRKVDNLTLNGKDFFKGKNKIMLENLPYYTVKEIKVFDKKTDKSEFIGKNVEDKELTMDVNLKKEYSIGILGNMELGTGIASQNKIDGNTDIKNDRFIARGIGIRFTNNSRITLLGDANNIGRNGYANNNGDWFDGNNSSQFTSKRLNADIMLNGKDNKVTNNIFSSISWRDNINESKMSSIDYQNTQNEYGMSANRSKSKDMIFSLNNVLRVKLPQTTIPFSLTSYAGLEWSKNSNNSNSDSKSFNSDPFDETLTTADTINSYSSKGIRKGNSINLYADNNASIKLASGDFLSMSFNINYKKQDNDAYRLDNYRYWNVTGKDNQQNRYDNTPTKNLNLRERINYYINWRNGWCLEMALQLGQQHSDNTNDLYRLDSLGGIYAHITPEEWYDMLPSTTDSLNLAIDHINTYREIQDEKNYGINIITHYEVEKDNLYKNFRINTSFTYNDRKEDYRSDVLTTILNDRRVTNSTSLTYRLQKDGWRNNMSINLYRNMNLPPLRSLIDVDNTTNELAIQRGNPNLKSSAIYGFNINKGLNKNHDFYTSTYLSYTYNQNDIVQGYSIDQKTNARTYRPENVNGNWSTNGTIRLGSAIDSMKLWHYALSINEVYSHNVELMGINGATNNTRNTIRRNVISCSPSIEYNKNKFRVKLYGMFSWTNTDPKYSSSFNINKNIYNYNYGMSLQHTFAFKLQLYTDFYIYSRRGYASEEMNVDKPIWNANISFPFCKNKLIAKLSCHDLLGKISNIDYMFNGTRRTESWNNSLGQHVILSLQWKFNKFPKGKKEMPSHNYQNGPYVITQ